MVKLAMLLAALLLSGFEVLRSQGQHELAWAVLLIALALILPRLARDDRR